MLDQAPSISLLEGTKEEDRMAWLESHDHDFRTNNYILASMNSELHRQNENLQTTTGMILNLTELYREESRTVQYDTSKQLFRSKMLERAEMGDHVLSMIDMIN